MFERLRLTLSGSGEAARSVASFTPPSSNLAPLRHNHGIYFPRATLAASPVQPDHRPVAAAGVDQGLQVCIGPVKAGPAGQCQAQMLRRQYASRGRQRAGDRTPPGIRLGLFGTSHDGDRSALVGRLANHQRRSGSNGCASAGSDADAPATSCSGITASHASGFPCCTALPQPCEVEPTPLRPLTPHGPNISALALAVAGVATRSGRKPPSDGAGAAAARRALLIRCSERHSAMRAPFGLGNSQGGRQRLANLSVTH